MDFKIGQTVYHREVYEHREPLEIVGIRKNELELKGDFSGAYNIIETHWMPIKGVSRVYNYKYKKESRKLVDDIIISSQNIPYNKEDTKMRTIKDLVYIVYVLTIDAALDKEY